MWCNGCVGSIVKTLVAPESVVGDAAGSLAKAGAETLSGASLEELGNLNDTVAEIDRIIEEHPDAVNIDNLRTLRETLKNTKSANSGPDQRQVLKEPPKPRRAADAPMPLRKGDRLTVLPPGEVLSGRRHSGRPEPLPDGSSLKPDGTPVHTMSLKPVRLTQ